MDFFFFFKVMKEKSDYEHVILYGVGTKVVGICTSKQNCVVKSVLETNTPKLKNAQTNKKKPKLPNKTTHNTPINKTPLILPPKRQQNP